MELKTAPILALSSDIDPQQKPQHSIIQSNVQQVTAAQQPTAFTLRPAGPLQRINTHRFLNVSGAEYYKCLINPTFSYLQYHCQPKLRVGRPCGGLLIRSALTRDQSYG